MASLKEIKEERKKKSALLREKGMSLYPVSSGRDMEIVALGKKFSALAKAKKKVALAGRVTSIRGQGAIVFFDIHDGTGSFQCLMKKDEIAEDAFTLFQDGSDIGDIVRVKGTLFITKQEKKALLVKEWAMLAKTLRPLPDKWHGLQDTEERYRRRYLDLLMSEESRARFVLRSRLVSEVRKYMDGEGFLEVETPVLQPLAGGAIARPFHTHHNALDIDLYLRIAPELYLKELLVGGLPKVYELGRLFRNEGIDTTHNPEFTTIELYEAYADATMHMKFLETMLRTVTKRTLGATSFSYDGHTIDMGKKFARVPFFELLKRYALIPNPETMSRDDLLLTARQAGVEVTPADPVEKIWDHIYKKMCRPKLIQPTFITDYPTAFSPLAKRQEKSPDKIDRFQVVIGGLEVVNAFSELNDPAEQEERFALQEKNKKGGDEEAHSTDREFIEALEYGMPPSAGLGMSIDRLAMLFSDVKNIREVILFPTLRPKDGGESEE